MYGKLFASVFTGSMVGSGLNVFAVWSYVIANTERDGTVELNPRIIATILGCGDEEVESAIRKLCAPDERSRNQTAEGRRLVQVAPFLYTVTTFEDYRGIRDEDGRKEYMRKYMREYRSKQVNPANTVNAVNEEANSKPKLAQLAHTDTDTDTKDQKTCAPAKEPPVAPGEDKSPGTKRAAKKAAVVPPKKHKRGGDAAFEAFWIEYPVHRGKKTARDIWKRKNLDERIDDLVEDVTRRVAKDDQWKRGFIPHPSTYLRQERWEDELRARAAAAAKHHTPSPAVAEPKAPAMTDEQRLVNQKRLDDLIKKTLAGRLAS